MAKTETQRAQEPGASISILKALPIYAFVIGAVITGMAAGAELIGISSLFGADGVWQGKMIQIGLIILGVGAVADLAFGQRSLLVWLKPIVLDWQGLLKFLTIAVQLSLLAVIMRMSYLEHSAFYHNVMLLTLYGFVIHYFLPQPYRLPFFVILSLAGIIGVFGLADGAWLIGLSLVLIGICHLPISFWLRVAILLVAGFSLIAMRAGYFQAPWTKALWPILASMFMFRMIIYLYDLKHKKVPPGGRARALAYFFLLPNVAFPLFPVVDYSTFCRTYYDDDQYRIYQRGLQWIFWGVIHLLIYRYINYYWIIDSGKVKDTFTLVQYMASNYLLILRLSGQFHLAVGILHLFGFNLPRIMDRYLLATDFNDYWRRVNAYWKEFVQKVFYYPAYFKMRKFGNAAKLVLATALGFVITWFFHGYQWFWIRGTFLFSAPDVWFWTCLGALVLANSLYEAKHGRKRVLVKRAATLDEIASKTLRAAGIFVVMMVLWSMWISPSLAEWFSLLAAAEVTGLGVLAALGVIVAAFGAVILVYEKWPALTTTAREKEISFFRFAAPMAGAIVLFYFLVQPEFYFRLGPKASDLIADLRTNRLNARDEALLFKGYYEKLTNVNQFNTQLGDLYAQRPDDWRGLTETAAVRRTNDLLRYELVPSLDGSLKDAPMKTNRWGMRDDDYEPTPLPNTYRIALLGGSVEMGSGVVHEETFEDLLEKRLNREHTGSKSPDRGSLSSGKYARYEILNFAVGGYHILHQLFVLENKALAFKPNAVFCVAHTNEEGRQLFKSPMTPGKIDPEVIPYEGLREILHRAGITRPMKTNKASERLEPFHDEIMLWAYSYLVEYCRQRDILPVWILLPASQDDSTRGDKLVRAAEQAGFNVLNLTDVYASHRAKNAYLQLAPWDRHPNARGHRLIAEKLYEALRKNEDKLHLGLSAVAPEASASGAE